MKTYPKKIKKAFVPRFLSNGSVNPLVSELANTPEMIAKRQKKHAEQSGRASWENEDGTTNWDAKNTFIEEREKAAWSSKSF